MTAQCDWKARAGWPKLRTFIRENFAFEGTMTLGPETAADWDVEPGIYTNGEHRVTYKPLPEGWEPKKVD